MVIPIKEGPVTEGSITEGPITEGPRMKECPHCKGTVELNPANNTYVCAYCGSVFPGEKNPPRMASPSPPPPQDVIQLTGAAPQQQTGKKIAKGCFTIIIGFIIFSMITTILTLVAVRRLANDQSLLFWSITASQTISIPYAN